MANQEKNPPQQEQPFVAAKQVGFNLEYIIIYTNNEVALLYPEHNNKDHFKCVFDFISKCCLRKPFTRSPNMYKEYLVEFWYSTKALDNSNVSFSTPTGGIYGKVGVNTFRNAIGASIPPRLLRDQACYEHPTRDLSRVSSCDSSNYPSSFGSSRGSSLIGSSSGSSDIEYPVGSIGKIFMTEPQLYLYALLEDDTQDLYALLEDAKDIWMVKEEAYASREAWAYSIGLSQVTYQELQTHRDHVYVYETHLQAHQTQLQQQGTLIQTQHQMVETLQVIRDIRREMSNMQAELLAMREQQRRARQPGPKARIPDHQDASGDADSHI
ncbi:hypothetical protein Tco_1265936 [Tanacetum coccineum]